MLSEQPAEHAPTIVAHRLTPTVTTAAGIEALAALRARRPRPSTSRSTPGCTASAPRPTTSARSSSSSPPARRTCAWPACSPTSPWPTSRPTRTRRGQLARFADTLAGAAAGVLDGVAVHAANSAGGLAHPAARHSFVRAGIALYGISPGPDVDPLVAELRPVLALKARVSFVKRLAAGQRLSYGLRHTVAVDTNVATVPLGYADGVRRGLSSNGDVLIGGRRRPIIGTVTMDQLMVDCGDDPVRARRRGRADRRAGRRAHHGRGVGGPAGHDRLRGGVRDRGPGAPSAGGRSPAPVTSSRHVADPAPHAAGALARGHPRRRRRAGRAQPVRRHHPAGRRDGRRQDGVRPGLRPGARGDRADHVADVHARAQLRHRRRHAAPRRPVPARAAGRGHRARPRRAGRVPRHRPRRVGRRRRVDVRRAPRSCASTSSTASSTPARSRSPPSARRGPSGGPRSTGRRPSWPCHEPHRADPGHRDGDRAGQRGAGRARGRHRPVRGGPRPAPRRDPHAGHRVRLRPGRHRARRDRARRRRRRPGPVHRDARRPGRRQGAGPGAAGPDDRDLLARPAGLPAPPVRPRRRARDRRPQG